MVNVPYRSSDSLVVEHLTVRLRAMRRMAGAIVLAVVAAYLLALLLQTLPEGFGGKALRDLVPTDNPLAAATFTA